MAQVVVRNLEADVKARPQERAARHGRSMEEEIRDILRDAVKGDGAEPPPLGTEIARLFRGIGPTSAIPEQRGTPARPARLDG